MEELGGGVGRGEGEAWLVCLTCKPCTCILESWVLSPAQVLKIVGSFVYLKLCSVWSGLNGQGGPWWLRMVPSVHGWSMKVSLRMHIHTLPAQPNFKYCWKSKLKTKQKQKKETKTNKKTVISPFFLCLAQSYTFFLNFCTFLTAWTMIEIFIQRASVILMNI